MTEVARVLQHQEREHHLSPALLGVCSFYLLPPQMPYCLQKPAPGSRSPSSPFSSHTPYLRGFAVCFRRHSRARHLRGDQAPTSPLQHQPVPGRAVGGSPRVPGTRPSRHRQPVFRGPKLAERQPGLGSRGTREALKTLLH